MLWLLWTSLAAAGSGPWTVDPGDHNLYMGVDLSRFEKVGTADSARTLGTPVGASQLTGVWTFGLHRLVDADVLLPLRGVMVAKPDSGFCTTDRPEGWCATTVGLADARMRVRLKLLDERAFRPLTLAVRAAVRSGAAYGPTRSRLTTLGDGSTDAFLGLAVGRTDTIGNSWYRVSAAADYAYRFGLARDGDHKLPADEVHFGLDGLASPVPWAGLGISVAGFHRLRGVDLDQVELDAPNTWVSLAATHVRLGPQLAVYDPSGWTVFASGQLAVFARNTPSDHVSVAVGVGRYLRHTPRHPSGAD